MITMDVERTAHCPERVFNMHNRIPYECKIETDGMTIKEVQNTTKYNASTNEVN